jgi:acetyl esterase/lipase
VSRLLLTLVTIGVLLGAVSAQAVEFTKDITFARRGGLELKLDIAVPAGDAKMRPAIMCIHGGGWFSGSRKSYYRHMEEIAKRGYVVATIDYRLTPVAPWPAQLEDVQAGLKWLVDNADKYGIDSERIGVVGQSAGGHLALMLGTLPKEEQDVQRVRSVVNFYGPAEMRKVEYVKHARGMVEGLIGGKLEDNLDKLIEISPITHIDRTDAPVLTFQGTKDTLVPFIQSKILHEHLQKAQVPNQLFVMEGAGHRIGGDIPGGLVALNNFCEAYLMSSRLPLVAFDDFDGDVKHWEPTDESIWKKDKQNGRSFYSLFKKKGNYKPKVRSPFNISLLKDVEVGEFVFDVDLRTTHETYGHQDLVLVFGYQNPSHFYYVHLGRKADAHANSIFLVNDAPRVSIAKKRTDGTDWSKGWHRARIKRTPKTGKVEVFFDNMQKPVMSTDDKTFLTGRIGIGSFDDTGDFDALRLWGTRAE